MKYHGRRAAVIGGSIGGLTAALLMRDLGFEVDVYERTPGELDGRGGGIVVQPEAIRWFKERSSRRPDEISTKSQTFRVIGAGNRIEFEEPVEWRFTSWGTFYRALLADFGRDHYHLGHFLVGFDQNEDDTVSLRFTNGAVSEADLVIFADGITSVGRERLLPHQTTEYVGYIGWRGTVPETELSDETRALLADSLSYSFGDRTHICMYPIPGPDDAVEPGERLVNYVWYRNLPETADLNEIMTNKAGIRTGVSVHPGAVQDRFIADMKAAAARDLSPAAAELVQKTEQPYIQPIKDFRPERMAFGQIALIGDGAFVARPHAAAGTAKAANEAWALAETLENQADGDIAAALAKWEPAQLEVGNALIDRIEYMGRVSQRENSWDPHDLDLRFGLLEGVVQPQY